MAKKDILFVGSFKNKAKDGSVGGQMFACTTIVNSQLSNIVKWTLIDTTADSNSSNSIIKRLYKSIGRFLTFMYYILTKKYAAILIFTSSGLSFWEKGIMVIVAKFFTKSKVIIAPRSGHLIKDVESNGKISKFIPYVLSKADAVICQSGYWKNYFTNLCGDYDSNKFYVIQNWIDVVPYSDISNSETGSNPVEILYLAWVDENKGIFELITAAKDLLQENLNFTLTIAGNGRAYDEIAMEIKKHQLEEKIILYGWALGKEKLGLLKKCNIFVLPSYYEGYPNSLLEAMASSTACIATAVGAIPDIIDDGINGFLVPPRNTDILKTRLRELILNENLRNQFSVNAQHKILSNNTIEIAINKLRIALDV